MLGSTTLVMPVIQYWAKQQRYKMLLYSLEESSVLLSLPHIAGYFFSCFSGKNSFLISPKSLRNGKKEQQNKQQQKQTKIKQTPKNTKLFPIPTLMLFHRAAT